MKDQCGEIIRYSIGGNPVSCSRRAKVERGGKSYCRQHDPVAVKSREDASSAKWEAERNLQRQIWDREKKALKLLSYIEANGTTDPTIAAFIAEKEETK